jgi:hypothetical protein
MMTTYIGNGAYCYANSTAMLLAAGGETISPGLIEVLTGVGLGAERKQGSSTVWFNGLAAMPDSGISRALTILGFEYTERAHDDGVELPLDELRTALEHGPVVLGPVNMRYLSYIPAHKQLDGVDHFVLAYALDEQCVHLHDPAGYPHVSLSIDDLALAWRADRIAYRRGCYRSWAAPRRTEQPDEEQIYDRALRWFAECYRASRRSLEGGPFRNFVFGSDAIRHCAASLRQGTVSGETRGHLVHFALQLGAKRALDYAAFFDARDPELASAKRRQALLFGRGHTQAVADDWGGLATTLEELADVEDMLEAALLQRVPEQATELFSA